MQNANTRRIFRYESSSDDDWGDEEELAFLQPPPMSENELEAEVNLCTTVRNNDNTDLNTINQNCEHKTGTHKKSRKKRIPIDITEVFKNINVITRANEQNVITNRVHHGYDVGTTSHNRFMDVSNFTRNETYKSNTTEMYDTRKSQITNPRNIMKSTISSNDSNFLGNIQLFRNFDNVIQSRDISVSSSKTGQSSSHVHDSSTSVINPIKTFANVTKSRVMSTINSHKNKTGEGFNGMTPVLNQATCNGILKLVENPVNNMEDKRNPSDEQEFMNVPTKNKKANKKSKIVISKISSHKNKTAKGSNGKTKVVNQATCNEILKLVENPVNNMKDKRNSSDEQEFVNVPTKNKKANKNSFLNSLETATKLFDSKSKLVQTPIIKSKSASRNDSKTNIKLALPPDETMIDKRLTKLSVYAQENLFEYLLDSNSDPDNDDKIKDLEISVKYNIDELKKQKQLIQGIKNRGESKKCMEDDNGYSKRVNKKQKKLLKNNRNDQEDKNINVSEELNNCKVGKKQKRLHNDKEPATDSKELQKCLNQDQLMKRCNNKIQQKSTTIPNSIVVGQPSLLNFQATKEMQQKHPYIISITSKSLKQFVTTVSNQIIEGGLMTPSDAFISNLDRMHHEEYNYSSVRVKPQKNRSIFRKNRSRKITSELCETYPNLDTLMQINIYQHLIETAPPTTNMKKLRSSLQYRGMNEMRARINNAVDTIFRSVNVKPRLVDEDGYIWIPDDAAEILENELKLLSHCELPRPVFENHPRPSADYLTNFYHTEDYLSEEIMKNHEEIELNHRVLFGYVFKLLWKRPEVILFLGWCLYRILQRK